MVLGQCHVDQLLWMAVWFTAFLLWMWLLRSPNGTERRAEA
jgi:hypothetical protein